MRKLRNILMLLVTAIFIVAWAFPIVWSVLNSFKTEQDILAYPPRFFFHPTLAAYREVLFGPQSILPNLWSSTVISVGTTVLTMVLAIPAAYALARLRVPGKRMTGFYVLVTQMLPPVGIIIPYFLLLRNIGWMDTYQGIIIIYLSFSLPFAIWLMVSYFEDIPLEMEEAAAVDGASRLTTLRRIILPQAKGGIAVTVVFVFLNAWNEFFAALVLLSSNDNFTLPVLMSAVRAGRLGAINWGAVQAGVAVMVIPCLFVFLLLQRYYMRGLMAGAVK